MSTRSPKSASLASMRQSLVGVAVAAAAITGAALSSATSETALRKSFVTALETKASDITKPSPRVASEAEWLSALRPDGPAPVTKTVSVGDRIVMTLSGVERTFLVASVAEFTPEIRTVDTASSPSRLVLVTARDAKDQTTKPIRFVMEIEGEAPAVATRRTDRAL
jgi:hypothetical protein